MAAVLEQKAPNAATPTMVENADSGIATFPGTVMAGNYIILVITQAASILRGISSIVDTGGHTYDQAEISDEGTHNRVQIYYTKVITGGSSYSVTVTFDSLTYGTVSASEWSGLAGSSVLSDTNPATGTGSGNGSVISTGNATPSASALYFGGCSDYTSLPNITCDYTPIHTEADGTVCPVGVGYRTGSGALDVSWHFDASTAWCAAVATFLEAAGGSTGDVTAVTAEATADAPAPQAAAGWSPGSIESKVTL